MSVRSSLKNGVMPRLRLRISRDNLISALGVASNVLYIIGSYYFGVPGKASLSLGCWLFIIGAIGGTIVAMHTCFLRSAGMPLLRLQAGLFAIASLLFVVGSVVMLPTMTLADDSQHDLFVGGMSAGLVFTVANVIFVIASLADSAHIARCVYTPPEDDGEPYSLPSHVVLAVVAMMANMLGSGAFLVGSALWLPDLDCGTLAQRMSVDLFIIGSVFFFIESLQPLALTWFAMRQTRTVAEPRRLTEEHLQQKLVSERKQPKEPPKPAASAAPPLPHALPAPPPAAANATVEESGEIVAVAAAGG